jgi:hypothetical protein
MPRRKKTMPVSALLPALLIALSLACAPVAAATPEEQHCVEAQKHIDAAEKRYNDNPTEGAFDHLGLALAHYQIHCLGSARPGHLSSLSTLSGSAQTAQPDHPAHPAHPAHPDQSARP